MALSQRTDWHRAYQNAQGVTVYSEYDDGSVGTFGIRFADGTSMFTAAVGTSGLQTISITGGINIQAGAGVLVKATGGAGGITLTLPTAVGLNNQACIKKVDSGVGAVTIATTGGQTIDGSSSYLLVNQWQYVTIQSDGANWLIVANN